MTFRRRVSRQGLRSRPQPVTEIFFRFSLWKTHLVDPDLTWRCRWNHNEGVLIRLEPLILFYRSQLTWVRHGSKRIDRPTRIQFDKNYHGSNHLIIWNPLSCHREGVLLVTGNRVLLIESCEHKGQDVDTPETCHRVNRPVYFFITLRFWLLNDLNENPGRHGVNRNTINKQLFVKVLKKGRVDILIISIILTNSREVYRSWYDMC